jgi:hypothetical protein
MFIKALIVVCVCGLLVCGVGGTLVAAAAVVEYLSGHQTPGLIVGALGAGIFGLGAIVTALLCARMAIPAVWDQHKHRP